MTDSSLSWSSRQHGLILCAGLAEAKGGYWIPGGANVGPED